MQPRSFMSPPSDTSSSTATSRPPSARPLTIYDVARHAGVSHQTVSRTLNGGRGVAADTLDRIKRVMHELGYSPNPSAQSLRRHDHSLIWGAVLIGGGSDQLETLVTLASEAREADAGLLIEMSAAGVDVEAAVHRLRRRHAQRVWVADGVNTRSA